MPRVLAVEWYFGLEGKSHGAHLQGSFITGAR